jgi:protein-disulfide isomerase-like protein with CxxC motif
MSFKPQGEVRAWDSQTGEEIKPKGKGRDNPVERRDGTGLAARFFVGLKVKDEVKWTAEDVIAIIVRVREEQKAAPDASLLTQRGIYRDSTGKIVDEPSLQIIIIDMAGIAQNEFVDEMTELGEALQEELEQETVIMEIQKRGIVIAQYWVTP